MPITTKQVRRYRGRQLILLRKVIKLAGQVANNQDRYPQPPTPNRNHLPDEIRTALDLASIQAFNALEEMWPPQTG